ncbi:MAG TPA: HEPN domain-containing protein [Dehalococcoidia bacterium]
MPDHHNRYQQKSRTCMAGAEVEFAAGRYANSVNRAYYSAFQMAVAARIADGDIPDNRQGQWRHGQTFVSLDEKFRRWGLAELAGILSILYDLRVKADYTIDAVSRLEAEQSVAYAKRIVDAIAMKVSFRR